MLQLSSALCALALLGATARAQTPYGPGELDDVEGSWINLNVTPIRPMAFAPDGRLFAVNTHDSTVMGFTGVVGDPLPGVPYATPWGPVSIAYVAGTTRDKLLVVCRASRCVIDMDPDNGRVYGLLELPFEPGDIQVVGGVAGAGADGGDGDAALISCSGADAVVQIAIEPFAIQTVYDLTGTQQQANGNPLRIKHPLFLSLMDGCPQGTGRYVLVAPMFSGNNSTSEHAPCEVPTEAGRKVLDLKGPGVVVPDPSFPYEGYLPDEDLLRIDPSAQTVEVVATELGTTLFAHGVNPADSRFWQLNTEALNKDPNRQTEPSVRGDFIVNRVSLTTLDCGAGPAVVTDASSTTYLNLDDSAGTGGPPYDLTKTVGQPSALAFDGSGDALIVGLLTNNVVWMDKDTNVKGRIDLGFGAIPRAVLWEPGSARALVYCWGLNRILAFDMNPVFSPATPVDTHFLGHDPAPLQVKRGRAHFYDAARSEFNNASCASCHIEGRTDMVVWNLSAGKSDDKGPMVTQTLAGIDRLPPFHWRGERPELSDFNPAFEKLLGGTQLDELMPDGEFDQFQAFVFSIQNTANPFQDERRVVSDAVPLPLSFPPGSAARAETGLANVRTQPAVGGASCNVCHQLPLGTNHDFFHDGRDEHAKRAFLKMTPFNGLWRKEQGTSVAINLANPSNANCSNPSDVELRAFLGAGATHAGLLPSMRDFVNAFFDHGDENHRAAFVHQVDQGIAPAAQRAVHLDGKSIEPGTPGGSLLTYLMPQAHEEVNCDVAVFGTVPDLTNAQPIRRRWWWDRSLVSGQPFTLNLQGFRSDDPNEQARSLRYFLNNARFAYKTTFVGLPLGMAERFAVDYDLDGDYNLSDPSPYDPTVVNPTLPPDTTAPSFTLQPRVLWVSAKAVRIEWETSEPTRWRIDWSSADGSMPSGSLESDSFDRRHSAVVTGLPPSTLPTAEVPLGLTFDIGATVRVWDRANLTDLGVVPQFATGPFHQDPLADTNDAHVKLTTVTPLLEDLTGSSPNFILDAQYEFEINLRVGGPTAGPGATEVWPPRASNILVARVYVEQCDGTTRLSDDFTVDNVNSWKASDFRTANLGGNPGLQQFFRNEDGTPCGPFLFSTLSDVSGIAKIFLTQGGLAMGEKLVVNIAGVYEAASFTPPAGPVLPVIEFAGTNAGLNKQRNWSFPDTPAEARAAEYELPGTCP